MTLNFSRTSGYTHEDENPWEVIGELGKVTIGLKYAT